MSKILLNAELRTKTGKSAAKSLKKSGRIPAVVYGSGDQPYSISVDEKEFSNKFKNISENLIISLNVDNKNCDVLIKDYEFSTIKNKVSHIDFLIVHTGHEIKTNVHIKYVGKSYGELNDNGTLEKNLSELKVSCLPAVLPEEIVIDVTNLKVGESMHVSQITGYEGVKFLNAADEVVVQVLGASSMSDVEVVEEEVETVSIAEEKAAAKAKEAEV